MSDLENLDQEQEQSEQEQPDAIQLLSQELTQLRKALGVGTDANESSLLSRLNAIEKAVVSGSPEVERRANLPKTITHSQLRNANWMRRHGVTLEDIGNRIQVVPDSEG